MQEERIFNEKIKICRKFTYSFVNNTVHQTSQDIYHCNWKRFSQQIILSYENNLTLSVYLVSMLLCIILLFSPRCILLSRNCTKIVWYIPVKKTTKEWDGQLFYRGVKGLKCPLLLHPVDIGKKNTFKMSVHHESQKGLWQLAINLSNTN